MWVGGCVTTPAMWASPPGRRRRSVHRLAKMASPRRFGAFVYTIGPWAWVVGSLGIATVYTNGRIGPLRAVFGHLCTLLGCCAVVDRRGDAGVYTNRWKWPLRAVLERLCTLLRRESRYELRRELRQVARAPQPPRRAGGAPSLAASPLVGKTGSARVAPLPGWHLGRDVNPHEPLKSPLSQCRPEGSKRQPGKSAIVNSSHASTPVFLWWAASESVTARTMPRWRFPPGRRPYPQTACRRPAE